MLVSEESQVSEPNVGTIDWTAALRQHEPWLRRVLSGRVGDRHEVDDLMQEIALAVVRQNSLPQDPVSVAPWLYRLAVRQAINLHRRLGRKSNANPCGTVECESRDTEPLDWLLTCERSSVVREAIQKMNVRDRELLMLKYTEDWSYKQLAARLGVHVKTIEYRLFKAKKRLRSLILERVDAP